VKTLQIGTRRDGSAWLGGSPLTRGHRSYLPFTGATGHTLATRRGRERAGRVPEDRASSTSSSQGRARPGSPLLRAGRARPSYPYEPQAARVVAPSPVPQSSCFLLWQGVAGPLLPPSPADAPTGLARAIVATRTARIPPAVRRLSAPLPRAVLVSVVPRSPGSVRGCPQVAICLHFSRALLRGAADPRAAQPPRPCTQ
jgi:hypothetical protein